MAISIGNELVTKLMGLLDNPEIGPRLKALVPAGFDPARLLSGLKADPELLAKVQHLLPGADVLGGLAGLPGAQAGIVVEAAEPAREEAEGILGKVKDLFGR